MKLIDYKVRIIDSKSGTAAKTRVFIESSDGDSTWATVGVSYDIIEASWLASATAWTSSSAERGNKRSLKKIERICS